jgi:hypothetical protein
MRDRQVLDLGELNVDQLRGVLVSQIVPVQIDVSEPLLILSGEVLQLPLAPARVDACAVKTAAT